MSESLTLYDIETGLMELWEQREQLLHDPQDWDTPEDLARVEMAISDYVQAEVQKADGIALYLKECGRRAEIHKQEAAEQRAKAQIWTNREDNLRAMVIGIMEAAGKSKIEGRLCKLSLRDNPSAVDVAQPEMVPDEFKRTKTTVEIDKTKIKAELAAGHAVPGCSLTRGKRLEVK